MSTVEGGGNIIQDNLVYFLDVPNVRSYDGGNVLKDLTRIENISGNLMNSPTYSSLNNGCLVFDGTNQYIALDKNIAFTANTVNKYSFSVWFSPSVLISSANSTVYMIFEAQNSNTGNATDNYIQIVPSNLGKISFTTFNSSGNDLNTTTNVWSINKWYHITCTYDGTTSKKSIYVNGILENSITISNNFFNTRNNFSLFTYTFSSPQFLFPCKFGNFTLYTKTLTDSEVLQNYNAMKGRYI